MCLEVTTRLAKSYYSMYTQYRKEEYAALPKSAPPKKRLGCIHTPLINIELTNIIIDELHLMLRISDVLLRNFLWAMIQQDKIEMHEQRPEKFLNEAVQRIQSCGITFKVHR